MAGEMTKTVLYYTANAKKLGFTAKVMDTLLVSVGDLPVVSVSHKPMSLGKNICVGDVGRSYLNVFRQMLIGLDHIDTDYVAFAEDDFLYPSDYFSFKPDGGDCYDYDNTWMVLWKGSYYRTPPLPGARIARTGLVRDKLTDFLKGHPEWADGPYDMGKSDYIIPSHTFTGLSVVAFKPTGNLSRSGTALMSVKELPVWGQVNRLRRQYDFE